MTPQLFEPITLGGITVKNRLWIAPMCQYSAEARDGVATSWHMVHLGSLARGGAGAVILEATAVSPEGRISPEDLGLWNREQEQALAPIIAFMRSQGAVVGIQLAHAGRKASTARPFDAERNGSVPTSAGGWGTHAPSAEAYPGLTAPESLDEAGIDGVVEAFATAAARAVRAGCELVEIHAAHGYLLHQFLSPLSNRRDDHYGGSLENRARLLMRVTQAVGEQVGDQAGLLVRISATDWHDDGLTQQDMVTVVQSLTQSGVHLVDVSSGGNAPVRIPIGPGYQVPLSSAIRQGGGLPTAAVGLITDPVQAEHIVRTEQADVVMVGREALRDPHFPLRAARALGHQLEQVPPQYERALR